MPIWSKPSASPCWARATAGSPSASLPGVVAKLPWRYDGTLRNESEYNAWSEADDDVRAMMLPPLDFVYPPGVIVFPEVEPIAGDSRA